MRNSTNRGTMNILERINFPLKAFNKDFTIIFGKLPAILSVPERFLET